MKTKKVFLLCLLAVISSSCAKNMFVSYQPESANTSHIILKPSKVSKKTNVLINDTMFVDCRKLKSVTIKNVPAGNYKIRYTSESAWYTKDFNTSIFVKSDGNGKTLVRQIAVPPRSGRYWLCMSLLVVWPLAIAGALTL